MGAEASCGSVLPYLSIRMQGVDSGGSAKKSGLSRDPAAPRFATYKALDWRRGPEPETLHEINQGHRLLSQAQKQRKSSPSGAHPVGQPYSRQYSG